jgi:hypothetical protein
VVLEEGRILKGRVWIHLIVIDLEGTVSAEKLGGLSPTFELANVFIF